jgi:hypothetical protein
MARNDSVVRVQLSMRIPNSLHRRLRLHCVTVDAPMMDFVTKAIEEKLAGSGGGRARRRGKKA